MRIRGAMASLYQAKGRRVILASRCIKLVTAAQAAKKETTKPMPRVIHAPGSR
jgi:hypothetical protein